HLFWGGLAVLPCPCHLPLLLAISAGSSFAALLNENLIITGTILTGLFLLCLSSALRAFRRIS
ncbi:mercury resistance protein, partial [Escherichia coli]|uniref:mercury resistance protein n=2 Tax=Enterobacterales TaxID=91347 RepID=UPI0019346DAF